MPNLPEHVVASDVISSLVLYAANTPTAPGEGEYAIGRGFASSRIYLYKSNSNAAEEFELTLVGGGQVGGVEVPFPQYPIIQFYSAGESERIKYSETALKVLKIEFNPSELVIKPIVITFETHATKPLKKGEVLLIRVVG